MSLRAKRSNPIFKTRLLRRFTPRNDDERFMSLALDLAARARGSTRPNPMVGAVVVRGGRIVGRGFHRRAGGPHAERSALRQAGGRARGATLYVSLEPCSHWGRTPPCTGAIQRAGIERVVSAMADPNPKNHGRGLRFLRRFGIRTSVGLLEPEARRINEIFVTWMTKKRPFVTVKVAQSLDGKIASASGESRWISSPPARRWAHRLRGEADALLVGVETVIQDDPRLTSRGKGRQPIKVVLDSRLRTPPKARLFRSSAKVLIATTPAASKTREKRLRRAGAEILRFPTRGARVNLRALLRELAKREISHLLIEGGGETIAAALSAGAVDRVAWVIAPKILGGRRAPTSVGGGGFPLGRSIRIAWSDVRRLGEDLLVMGKVAALLVALFAAPVFAEETSASGTEDGSGQVHAVRENLQAVEAEVQKLGQTFTRPGGNELVLAATQGNAAGARLLLDRGADPNERDSYGTSPIEAAALGGHAEVVKALVARGGDVNLKGLLGVTPLMLAAEKGHLEVARELIGSGAEVNAASQTGRTALLVAERNGHTELAAFLTAAGAAGQTAPPRPDRDNRVPDRSELVEMVSSGDLDSDLIDAAVLGDAERVNLLLRQGARVNAQGAMGMTALMHAAQSGQAGTINELLLAGADVNARSRGGDTALACAAMAGHAGVIHNLVLWGADVHIPGFAGMTALMHAAQNGHTEAARVLISWGSDVNQMNEFGMTPLMFSARKGHLETLRLLLEMGSDLDTRERIADQTAEEIARAGGHPEAAELLRKAGIKE
ncbi:MAG: bifunctional diaminohydroxyphosphoribosylaminopyrimidine deaminase/5-amino-6-(5-phosphoribosylamino)uracil reductase RibD [Candidatus Omnitrophica bacterium]|nr:bifunctional diaminohydroxyphosphoribosylaminopyrimidine deaminase/5-amino-6-(5-phosphoribosylamino)uracil reductase RibD [Candidatus Omnitrophota bacterium]